MSTLRRALGDEDMPKGIVSDLQRLYEEAPGAMEAFAKAVGNPSHTQSVTLRFHGGRLQTAVVENTYK